MLLFMYQVEHAIISFPVLSYCVDSVSHIAWSVECTSSQNSGKSDNIVCESVYRKAVITALCIAVAQSHNTSQSLLCLPDIYYSHL